MNILICEGGDWSINAGGSPVCSGVVQQIEYVEASSILGDLLTATEFSPEAAGMGFGGGLTLFVAGLSIGFIIKFLRRL